MVCWRVAVTCWLVPAAAASCRHVTRCSRRPCSGPCTWRCTSGEGKDEPLRSGPRLVPPPRQRTAHAQHTLHAALLSQRTRGGHPNRVQPATPPPLVLPAPNCPGNPPASRYTSGSTCPSSSVGTREPSVATPAPTDPAALSLPPSPRPAPDLQQLLRVGHGDLHFHLLHDEPWVQLPAARAPEIRAEPALHGSAKSTGPPPRAPTRTHAGSPLPQGPTGNGVPVGGSRVWTTSPIKPREASRARAERKGPKSVSGAEARTSVLRLRPQRSRRACTLDDGRAYPALRKPHSARPLGDQERCGGGRWIRWGNAENPSGPRGPKTPA